jgi:hypothetical protein
MKKFAQARILVGFLAMALCSVGVSGCSKQDVDAAFTIGVMLLLPRPVVNRLWHGYDIDAHPVKIQQPGPFDQSDFSGPSSSGGAHPAATAGSRSGPVISSPDGDPFLASP